MSQHSRSFIFRYGCAFVSIALAIVLRLLLDPVFGVTYPFATVWLAVLVTAWYGGFRPALAAVVLGALASNFFLMPPRWSFELTGLDQQMAMALFYLFTGLGIALLAGSMHAARHRAESTAESGRHQAALIDQTYDAVLVWDWNGPITFWNRGAERLYGFPRVQALERVSHDLLDTKTSGGVATFLGVLEREGLWEGDLHHTSRDGHTIIVESRMVLVREAGRAFVLEANRDITERKKAEEELREANDLLETRVRERTAELAQTNDRLRASEEHLRVIVEGVSSHAIFMLDSVGNVASWNPGAERIKGYNAEEMVGQHFSRFYPPEDIANGKPQRDLQIAVAEGCFEEEGVRVRKDGSQFWAIVTITPLYDHAPQPIGFVKVTRDITERKALASALQEAARFNRATLDGLSAHIAILDEDGTITAVNKPWDDFAAANGLVSGSGAIGANYLMVCDRSVGPYAEEGPRMAAGIRAVLAGSIPQFDLEYPCDSPDQKRWFIVRVTPFPGEGRPRAIVAHENITERKRAEKSLQESQERLHAVVENINEGVVISDLDGQFRHWNRAALDMHGFASSEEWCRRLPEFFDLFELSTVDGRVLKFPEWPMARLLRGERFRNYELRVRQLDLGWERIFSYGGDVVLDAVGKQVAFLTMFDITERKKSEAALRDRERLLGFVTGSARVGLVMVDGGYRYLFANEAYAEIFGLDSHEIVGCRVPDVLAAGWPQIQPRLDRALAGEQVAYELTLPPLPGAQEARYFTVVYEPRMGDGGEPTVVVVVVDITERKRAEEALRERERTLLLFITHAPAAIAMFDCHMAYVSASHRWLTDYGLEMQDISGRSHYELFPNIPDRWKDIHRRCLAGATEKCAEEQFPRLDGTLDWIRWEVLPWYKSTGTIGGIIIFSETITQHKQAEEALRRLNAKLEKGVHHLGEVNRELKERTQENEAFVYSVSHDLRSPLVNLQGFSKELARAMQELRAHLVERELPQPIRDRELGILDGPMAKSIRFIQTAVTRLGNIIDALLRLSRAGRVIYQRERVDVKMIVARVIESLRGTADERGAIIQTSDLPAALGDPAALEQVFANLLGNALNYLDGQRPGRIEIGSLGLEEDHTAAGLRTYYIRDNGLGISETGKTKVFQPFQRLHPQAAAGEGLGLAIVQRVVERHGGSIWFESAVGQGSTFFVSLPAFPNGASAALRPAAPSASEKGPR